MADFSINEMVFSDLGNHTGFIHDTSLTGSINLLQLCDWNTHAKPCCVNVAMLISQAFQSLHNHHICIHRVQSISGKCMLCVEINAVQELPIAIMSTSEENHMFISCLTAKRTNLH